MNEALDIDEGTACPLCGLQWFISYRDDQPLRTSPQLTRGQVFGRVRHLSA